KYTLEGKSDKFFKKIDSLTNLTKDYNFWKNTYAGNFIIEIEKTFNPNKYHKAGTQQGDFGKILDINGKLLNNEFNLGLITYEERWIKILSKISRNNRAYRLGSLKHDIALFIKNGQYFIYDPSYDEKTKFKV